MMELMNEIGTRTQKLPPKPTTRQPLSQRETQFYTRNMLSLIF